MPNACDTLIHPHAAAADKIRLGVSTCLLGENVRYDGGHKLDRWVTGVLGQYVEFVPVCPEVECGLPVPREAMRLVGDPAEPRLVTQKTGIDHTEKMQAWGRGKLLELEQEDLCGYIFKSKSPSSGMQRVKVYKDKGMPDQTGVGIWARMFMERFPLLPVEEEGRLNDARLRESFIERIFLFKRLRDVTREGKNTGNLVKFHTENKLLLMAHDPVAMRAMGKLTADGKGKSSDEMYCEYVELLSKALSKTATVKKNVNVLMHIMGHFKKQLSSDEKQELLEIIDHYHKEYLPLIVPVTLLNHYVRKYDNAYLAGQYYLHPHPIELKLRNHV